MAKAKKTNIPANLPDDAWGYVAVCLDRPERLAAYDRNGRCNTMFAFGAPLAEIAPKFAHLGYAVDGEGFIYAPV